MVLLQFQRPVDARPLRFKDLPEVKKAVQAADSPFKEPVRSLVGTVMLGDLAIDARWVAWIALSDKPFVEMLLRVPSPLPKYPSAGSDYLELRLRCDNAAQWQVTGEKLPWFEESASSISGTLGDWLSRKEFGGRTELLAEGPILPVERSGGVHGAA